MFPLEEDNVFAISALGLHPLGLPPMQPGICKFSS